MSPLLPSLTEPPSGLPRVSVSLLGGITLGLALFWFLQMLLVMPAPGLKPKQIVQVVELVEPEEEKPQPPSGGSPPPPMALPPPPPSLASLSELTVPIADLPDVTASAPSLDFSPNLSAGKGFGTAFSGFSGKGSGTGSGSGAGSGFGTGQGFKGATLVPLSTQRPQNPPVACQRAIKGWVQVVYIVNGDGRVSDIKIVDADPKGVFEAATIAGVSTWLYERYYVSGKPVAREVTQRIEFAPEDCQYNWN